MKAKLSECVSPCSRPLRILVTAGPTREYLDPVRFISNPSTGTMGFEIARQARRRGHKVTLICGPTYLLPPRGARLISVETAIQMKEAVEKYFPRCNCLIMAAAVSDWRPSKRSSEKIKRSGASGTKKVSLELVENPDILKQVSRRKGRRILVGFALETEALMENARQKLLRKNLDFIVANGMKVGPASWPAPLPDRQAGRGPFGDKRLTAVIISKDGTAIHIKNSPKSKVAKILLDLIKTKSLSRHATLN